MVFEGYQLNFRVPLQGVSEKFVLCKVKARMKMIPKTKPKLKHVSEENLFL
jgi:hypothetical protein